MGTSPVKDAVARATEWVLSPLAEADEGALESWQKAEEAHPDAWRDRVQDWAKLDIQGDDELAIQGITQVSATSDTCAKSQAVSHSVHCCRIQLQDDKP